MSLIVNSKKCQSSACNKSFASTLASFDRAWPLLSIKSFWDFHEGLRVIGVGVRGRDHTAIFFCSDGFFFLGTNDEVSLEHLSLVHLWANFLNRRFPLQFLFFADKVRLLRRQWYTWGHRRLFSFALRHLLHAHPWNSWLAFSSGQRMTFWRFVLRALLPISTWGDSVLILVKRKTSFFFSVHDYKLSIKF